MSFAQRLIAGTVLILLATVVALVVVAERSLRGDLVRDLEGSLTRDAALVRAALPTDSLSWEEFARRFGARPVEWHSDVGSSERRQAWRDVADGTARVVVGARSALFLPFRELALIVLDEEHDQSFKQEDGVIYNARDMAIVRARLEACPVVLCSATPSLETWNNATSGRYGHLRLCIRYHFGHGRLRRDG